MDFSTLANEVIQHFAAQAGVEVTVTVEIEAKLSPGTGGFDPALQRTIKENCAVLRFQTAEFEK